MACCNPLQAWSRTLKSGKKDLVFRPHRDDVESIVVDGFTFDQKLLLPCGQCVQCRLKRSQDWATRCMLEAKQYPVNWFVTLTYDDLNLPYGSINVVDKDTGEVFERDSLNPTLCKNHLSCFMKNFRSYCHYHFGHDGVRFFSCGEYGALTSRPHYHLILFNVPEQLQGDLKFWKNTNTGDAIFTSEKLDFIWRYGLTCVGDVTFQSAAYVARYIMKKQTGKAASIYEDNGIEPEFCLMSRKPGLGREWFDKNKDHCYEFDEIYVPYKDGSRAVPPPHYFDTLYELEEGETFKAIKEHRRDLAMTYREQALKQTSLSPLDFDKAMKYNKEEQLKKLVRPL